MRRRRFGPLVLVGGTLVVGGELFARTPTEVEVEFSLGSAHTEVRQVDVAYLADGELVRRVSLRFPGGAPERVRHTVELAPGHYRVQVDVQRRDAGTESRSGRLDAPAEGLIRLHLDEET